MTADNWYQQNKGKSILVPGGGAGNEGQCVQAWDSYIHDVQGVPYFYTPAASDLWFHFTQLGLDKYFTQIIKGSPVQAGDSVIYDSRVGATQGHVDNCSRSGGAQDFWAYDSNWGHVNDPITGYPVLHEVHHNDYLNNYILGYLRLKGGNVDNVNYDALVRRILSVSTLMAQPGNAPDRQPTQAEMEDGIARARIDTVAYIDNLLGTAPWGANWNKVKHYDEDVKNAASTGYTPYTGPQLFTKK